MSHWGPSRTLLVVFDTRVHTRVHTLVTPKSKYMTCRGRHSLKLFEAHKDEFTMTVHADWAAQPEVPRGHNATCASKATVNLLVIVVGYLPYEKTFTQRTRRGFVYCKRRGDGTQATR